MPRIVLEIKLKENLVPFLAIGFVWLAYLVLSDGHTLKEVEAFRQAPSYFVAPRP